MNRHHPMCSEHHRLTAQEGFHCFSEAFDQISMLAT